MAIVVCYSKNKGNKMDFKPTLHKLSNGVTVILDPMDLETVAIKVRFATGSRDETPDVYGITHFCEHMLCKGTKKLPTSKALTEFLENNGGGFSAATSPSRLIFSGRIVAENAVVLLENIADRLKNSLFDLHKIEIERDVILDELRRAKGNNNRKYLDFIFSNLFGFSDYRTLGTEENIKSFTREQLLNWTYKRLSAKNCTIGISGRIDNPDVLLKKIEELFNFLPTHDVEIHKQLIYTPCVNFLPEPSLKNVQISILFPRIRQDTYENIRANLAEFKFHKYLAQEVREVVRQQNGLVYSLNMVAYGNEFDGVIGFKTETAPENLEKTIALIAQTSYRVYNHDKINDTVIHRFLNRQKLSNADFLESAVNRCDTLIDHWVDFGKLYDFNKIVEMDYDINADEVIAASAGFFDGQVSIMTFGATHNVDLRKIWTENFKKGTNCD